MARLTGASIAKISLLLFLMLIIFAAAGLGSCTGWWSHGRGYSEIGNAEVAASEVDSFDIDWAAGSVDVEVYDGDKIILTEKAAGITRAQSMRWEVTGRTLKVDYGNWTSCFNVSDKQLTVRIPRVLADKIDLFDIDGASGEYNISDITCKELKISLASGRLQAEAIKANDATLEAASGDLRYGGIVSNALKIDVASGISTVSLKESCPRQVDADMASGTVTIFLPQNDGFTAKVDSLSGSFESDFELTKSGDSLYTYKQGGSCQINADMASGQFVLKAS